MTTELEFDPSDYTAAEVLDYVRDNPEDRQAVRDAEAAGKARVSILTQLDRDTEDDVPDTDDGDKAAKGAKGKVAKSAEALAGTPLEQGAEEEGQLRARRRVLNEEMDIISLRLAYLNSNQYEADLARGTVDPPSEAVQASLDAGQEAIDADEAAAAEEAQAKADAEAELEPVPA